MRDPACSDAHLPPGGGELSAVSIREELRLFHSLDVLACFSIYLQKVPNINEEGSRNGCARFKGNELVAASCSVPLNGWRGFRNLELDLDGDFERDGLFVEDEALNRRVLGKPLNLVVHRFLRESKTILWVAGLTKPRLTTIRVEVGCVHALDLSLRNALVLVEGDLDHLSGYEVLELGLIDRLSLLHAEDVRIKHFKRLALIDDEFLAEYLVVYKH